MSDAEQEPRKDQQDPAPLGILAVAASVFRAWFGVQNRENQERDFNSKDPTPFIVVGVLFTLIMIGGVLIAVNMALSSAGH